MNSYRYAPNPIGWVDPLGLAGVKGDCPLPNDRRAHLNERYGRTGNINEDITSRGKKETATEFYRSQGFEDVHIPSHLDGIDFSKPVTIETLNRGKSVYQFQSPGAPQGKYYSLNPSTTPSELGIGPLGENRIARTVELKLQKAYRTTQKTPVLKSTAKAIDDIWSVKGMSQQASGGGKQIFTGMKENFQELQ